MGLLDEAIKQHLELKRRRGADPTEIERLEREALGPVRRLQQEAADEGEPGAGQVAASYETPEVPAGLEADDEFEDEYEADDGYEAYDEHEHMTSVQAPAPAGAGSPAHDELDEDEPGELPPPPPPPATAREDLEPAGPHHDVGVETAEYDVEAEHAREGAQEGEEGEDVLEETPEFFQDAPDHDRLWFEQRPPKDFDFDG